MLLIVMAAETPRRRPSHSRRIPVQKTLFGASVTGQSFCGEAWSKRETQALVDHVMLMGDAHVWPAFPRNSIDVISRLRPRTVPLNYEHQYWCPGT